MSSHRDYTAPAKWLHWLMAILIVTAAVIGIYASTLDYGVDAAHDAYKGAVITLHKSIASVTIFLIVLRIFWRLTHRPPDLRGMSAVMARAAHLGHLGLYFLMIAVPVSGWAYSSVAGYPVPVGGLFVLPPLLEKSKDLIPVASEAHELFAYALVVLAAGHVAAALKHQFFDHDGVLRSMLPRHR